MLACAVAAMFCGMCAHGLLLWRREGGGCSDVADVLVDVDVEAWCKFRCCSCFERGYRCVVGKLQWLYGVEVDDDDGGSLQRRWSCYCRCVMVVKIDAAMGRGRCRREGCRWLTVLLRQICGGCQHGGDCRHGDGGRGERLGL